MRNIRRPRDLNKLASEITSTSLDESPKETELPKKKKSAIRGREGGLRGGRARAEKLTAEQRSKIAQIAAQARWRLKDP